MALRSNWAVASSVVQSAAGRGQDALGYLMRSSERTLVSITLSIGVVGVSANKDMIVFVVRRVAASSCIASNTRCSAGTIIMLFFIWFIQCGIIRG